MTETTTVKFPTHYDVVGSLLRTPELKDALVKFDRDELTATALKAVQRAETQKVVAKEVALGLRSVTDGEFNRNWWHLDFWKHLTGISEHFKESISFAGGGNKLHTAQLVDRVAFNPAHPFFEDYQYTQSLVPAGVRVKQTIPSPTLLFGANWHDVYEDWDSYLSDLAQAYHETILHFYALGNRYLQLDDTNWAYLISELNATEDNPEAHANFESQAKDAVALVNAVLKDLPADLTTTTHICRGNFKSTYVFSGSYDVVAKYLGQLNYDGLFLEYDSQRAGGFEPLDAIWQNDAHKRLILGLVTSKTPELEPTSSLEARLNEAAQHVPLENLGLSTQCGFASSTVGNLLTQEEEWQKLRHVIAVAKQVWSSPDKNGIKGD